MLVVTTENIPGKKYEVLGEVFGVTTQSKNFVRNIGAGLKNIVGGEIKDYTKMLHEARMVATAIETTLTKFFETNIMNTSNLYIT